MATATKEQRALVVQVRTTQLAQVTTLVQSGDPHGAERALVTIADKIGGKEGDKALVASLAQVKPTDLVQILMSTATRPSAIVGDLVTPSIFVKALTELPKLWGPNDQIDAKRQLEELFIGVVMRPNSDGEYGVEARKFFAQIYKSSEATRLLAWWLQYCGYEPLQKGNDSSSAATEVLSSDDDGEQAPEDCLVQAGFGHKHLTDEASGSWRHLAEIMAKHALHGKIVAGGNVSFKSLLPSVPLAQVAGQASAPPSVSVQAADEQSAL
jgi:hypothetical protein